MSREACFTLSQLRTSTSARLKSGVMLMLNYQLLSIPSHNWMGNLQFLRVKVQVETRRRCDQ